MFRKICVLSFLFILAASTALNAAKPEKQTSTPHKEKGTGYGYPLHCLQNYWLDYPGPGDIYQSVKLAADCGSTPEEELWYGEPVASDSFPEDCEICEGEDSERAAVVARGPLPPHKLALNKANAWKMLQVGLEAREINTSLLTPQCHKISQSQLPAGVGHDVYFLAVPLPPHSGSKIDGVRYLGIETRQLPTAQVDAATFTTVEKRDGQQLWIDYTVGSDHRKGYVWLKEEVETNP